MDELAYFSKTISAFAKARPYKQLTHKEIKS